jgi:hypothetical protein
MAVLKIPKRKKRHDDMDSTVDLKYFVFSGKYKAARIRSIIIRATSHFWFITETKVLYEAAVRPRKRSILFSK